MPDQWWEQDPVDIEPQDGNDQWLRHDPPPTIRRIVGFAPVGWDKLAEASAQLLGYDESGWELEGLRVRMLGPIEYAQANVMPDQLQDRVRRATAGIIDHDNVFDIAEFFDVGNRFVPKSVKINSLHHAVQTMVCEILARRVLAVPRRGVL